MPYDDKIDIVYTWVTNQDPAWQSSFEAERRRYPTPSWAVHPARFRDQNELKYSLRSVEQFAPFIRNIFIVTNGQIPNWLNTSHNDIRIIRHEDIFEPPGYLPTFSSSSIEAFLHRIPGLNFSTPMMILTLPLNVRSTILSALMVFIR